MHLAVATGWLAWRPRALVSAPGTWLTPLLAGGALLLPMAVDVAGGAAGLWPGSGWSRAATGLLGGLGIALLLRIGDALASDATMPRPDTRQLLTGLAAAAAALLLAGLAPPAAGGWLAAAAVVASASLTIRVVLRAVTGGG
jgi:hypothetical protein